MRPMLMIAFAVAATPAAAQVNTGNAPPGSPRPSTLTTNRVTDIPFTGSPLDRRGNPFQRVSEQETCLERKSDGRTICHTRAEWEKIAKELAPAR